MLNIKDFVALLVDNKMKSVSVYDLSENGEEKYVVLCTSSKVTHSKKAADVIAENKEYPSA